MRKMTIAVTTVVLAMTVPASPAGANGGAYVTFDQTYYVPGARVEAEAYVYVPAAKQALLDAGPFTLYAFAPSTQLRQDAPVPARSTMLSALTVHDDGRDGYELTASFTLPSLAPGEYAVGMCSPGCALTGFGEPLTGSFVVAATAREAELLRRNDELTIAAANMERRLKKADRQIVELDEALALAHDARDAAATDARAALAAEGARADAAVAGEERAVDASFRWRVVALVTSGAAIVALSLWLTARRRRPHDATTVPDTP